MFVFNQVSLSRVCNPLSGTCVVQRVAKYNVNVHQRYVRYFCGKILYSESYSWRHWTIRFLPHYCLYIGEIMDVDALTFYDLPTSLLTKNILLSLRGNKNYQPRWVSGNFLTAASDLPWSNDLFRSYPQLWYSFQDVRNYSINNAHHFLNIWCN